MLRHRQLDTTLIYAKVDLNRLAAVAMPWPGARHERRDDATGGRAALPEGTRRLGFDLTAPSTELMRFARFADARDHKGPLTRELQLEWARQHVRSTSTVTAARRIRSCGPFAAYYRQIEANTEVLPTQCSAVAIEG